MPPTEEELYKEYINGEIDIHSCLLPKPEYGKRNRKEILFCRVQLGILGYSISGGARSRQWQRLGVSQWFAQRGAAFKKGK